MSLRIQAQPPVPISENLLDTMPAMIGAPVSSCVTVSREKPDAVGSISHVIRVKPSFFVSARPVSPKPHELLVLWDSYRARHSPLATRALTLVTATLSESHTASLTRYALTDALSRDHRIDPP